MIKKKMRERLGIKVRINLYKVEEMEYIVRRGERIMKMGI